MLQPKLATILFFTGQVYWTKDAMHLLVWLSMCSRVLVCGYTTHSGLGLIVSSASSTDVERAFSRGGLVVSKRRHRLSDETTRAAAVFGSWVAKGGIVPEKKILKNIANKGKRKRSEAEVTDGSESASESELQSESEAASVVISTEVITIE